MANAYYDHIAVSSPQEASIFSDEYTWTVLDILRTAGAKGHTAKEVHQLVEKNVGTPVSRSRIYTLLKSLYEDKLVHRYYDKDAEAQRNAIASVWGHFFVKQKFAETVLEKEKKYIIKHMLPVYVSFVRKVISDLKEDPIEKKWLPHTGSAGYCKRCHHSHEAVEFFSAVIDVVTSEIMKSEEFIEFLEDHDFAMREKETGS